MSEEASFSDINWSTSERPLLTAVGAGIGALTGYTGGVDVLLWSIHQSSMPWRDVIPDLYHDLLRNGPLIPMPWGWLPAACAIVGALILGWLGWVAATRPNVRHIAGPQLHTKPEQAAAAFRSSSGKYLGGKGVPIHPKVHIGEDVERRHILALGGPGSGKTTVLWPLVESAIARGDKVLILDFKGDFTSGIGGKISLLSPTDARATRWALGRDIQTRLDAIALAETLIPLGAGDPIWSQGARGLLVGLLSHLQRTKPQVWGFRDLAQLAAEVLVNYKSLVRIIIKEHPPR